MSRGTGILKQSLPLSFAGESLPVKELFHHLSTIKETEGVIIGDGLKKGVFLFIHGVRLDLVEDPLKDGDVVAL